MSGTYTKEMHEQFRKEQDQKAAKEEEARNARIEKENARRAWKAEGGSEADFEKEWPKLRDQGRYQRVMSADQKARETMRAHGPSHI